MFFFFYDQMNTINSSFSILFFLFLLYSYYILLYSFFLTFIYDICYQREQSNIILALEKIVDRLSCSYI